jgi:predicted TIM-barrel fold metal-dependent hydrolase
MTFWGLTMIIETVQYRINWKAFHKGASFFVPCINWKRARRQVLCVTDRLGMEVIIDPGPPGNPGYQVDAIDGITSRMSPIHFVLEHLGYLLRGQQSDAAAIAQRSQLLELAHKPNVWLGLSAVPVLLDDDYPCHRSTALLREAVERVGARKLIWGSDGPITLNRHTYRQLVDTIRRGSDFLSEKEKRQILCDNAREVYRGLSVT